ncbi:hypothetical protein NPD7_2663 [Clostridium sporogenes]|uniref:hypothetical protein n=1 Tax=Clostridium TaxID=1485 RepID=UPI00090AD601|nr:MULTISPECIES: hypothetical protein [Clostridium]APF26139.1 hypothetical protein NPD7_2663 [Clostridium sporogenes]MDI6918705.1 hypothetical protein [Clostridium botulinum]WMU98129.1 hypothetical protein QA656_02365 [Clostridium botulinum]
MFNYYNPCSMCMPVPIYLKGPYPMMPMGYGCDHVSETKENDDDLKCLYPRIYFKVYPLVKRHCDMMEREKDKDYCPCEKEIADACKEIYKRIKHELDDDDDDDYTRQRRYRRRHAINDLIRIILISELFGRRRRRRRRRHSDHNPNYGYDYNYYAFDNDDDYYDFDDDDDD